MACQDTFDFWQEGGKFWACQPMTLCGAVLGPFDTESELDKAVDAYCEEDDE